MKKLPLDGSPKASVPNRIKWLHAIQEGVSIKYRLTSLSSGDCFIIRRNVLSQVWELLDRPFYARIALNATVGLAAIPPRHPLKCSRKKNLKSVVLWHRVFTRFECKASYWILKQLFQGIEVGNNSTLWRLCLNEILLMNGNKVCCLS